MNDRETAKKGRELASYVISMNQVCDRSRLDELELERLNKLVEIARSMFADPGEYNPGEDDKSFGC